MVANLCLHRGAVEAPEEVVRFVPAPAATRSWNPISHARLLDQVGIALSERSFSVTRKTFALSHEGNRLFGVLDIADEDDEHGDFGLSLGIRNSTDKSLSAGVCFGSRVFVCDNLCFSGEVVLAKKHTARIMDCLPAMIRNALDQFPAAHQKQQRLFDDLRRLDLAGVEGRRLGHDFIIQAYRGGAVPASGIGRVADLWADPPHPEFHEQTGWSLHNAFTEYFKTRQKRNPFSAARETMVLNRLFDDWNRTVCSQECVV